MYTEKIKSLYKKYIENKGKFQYHVVESDELLLDYTIISHSLMTCMDEDTRYKAKELDSVLKDAILLRMNRKLWC